MLDALPAIETWLKRRCDELATAESETKVGEWVLDNAHQIVRTVRDVARDLPASYYRRLPSTGAEGAGPPRVYVLARQLAARTALQIDLPTILRFVTDQQQKEPLAIAELWAFPTMLRLLCVEIIVDVLTRAQPAPRSWRSDRPLLDELDDDERIGRAVRALLAVSAIRWRDFVDRTSVIDAVLADDPSSAYPRMDFETRDRYRKAVEELAERSGVSEADVARVAIARARDALAQWEAAGGEALPEESPREVCAGYWLIAEGRILLEDDLDARVPVATRIRRDLARRAVRLYLASITAGTAAVLAAVLLYLDRAGASGTMVAVGLLVGLLPACTVAISFVHWVVARSARPRVLPKLDFADGIPERWRTAVVVPTMLDDVEEIDAVLEILERHYLGNPDPNLVFVLLTDFADAPAPHMPQDEELFARAVAGVRSLNQRHPRARGDPFHLAHRERRFNAGEGCWMGWERKRGKLEEWNCLLRGRPTSFVRGEGDTGSLSDVRFVITLDSDTVLPRGAAASLVGTLAHPLNRPVFDVDGRVFRGYSIIQPRIAILPTSGSRSTFSRVFAGDTAIDIYSRAVSDVYQDLFGTGLYVGKGIYDVDAFMHALEGRVPENTIASHDMFEGLHARVALASDILLYEEFPPHYLGFVRRLHRWVRGDWQLLPWLQARVPARSAARVTSRFSTLEYWQIADNLRRSLLAPALVTLLLAGWLVLPGSAVVWTTFALVAIDAHCGLDLLARLAPRRGGKERERTLTGSRSDATLQLARIGLMVVFLPFEAWIVLDAIARTLVRVLVTHRRLLEWRTSARVAASSVQDGRAQAWREMAAAPVLGAVIVATIPTLNAAAVVALPFAAAWLLAPEIAYRISLPRRRRPRPLSDEQSMFLRRLARRTWLFFETFVGPQDHWLPPDNYQELPSGRVDHRTSPTNIGMLLLSTMGAWDMGYIGAREMAARLRSTLDTLDHLDRYHGHLLNWYDTRTLEPLSPRYVSTVDSGNLAAALIAISRGCHEVRAAPLLTCARWNGLMDALAWLEEALGRLAPEVIQPEGLSLSAHVAVIRRRAGLVRDVPSHWSATIADLCTHACADFDRLLLATIEAHRAPLNIPALHEVRIWLGRVHGHLRSMHDDLENLTAWLCVLDRAEVGQDGPTGDLSRRILDLLPPTVPLCEIAQRAESARRLVAGTRATGGTDAASPDSGWLADLDAALARSAESAAALVDQYQHIAGSSEAAALAMDFGFLYDRDRNLFHIGYNASAEALDSHYYDLLASECRLASVFAIAKGDVPLTHWFHLGRPLTRVGGEPMLLSWGGTMFEFLMPRLLLRSGENELLGISEQCAIDAQKAFGRRHRIPWGVSESGFAAMDAEHNYQYRAFGVPGLGLRRDLGKDLVVAPYATALALPLRPQASVRNLLELRTLGALGEFGLHEAVDFTPSRLDPGSREHVVRSYMAHHQGMAFAALVNHLCDFPLVRRMHDHPLLRTVEILLHERVPARVPLEFLRVGAEPARRHPESPRTLYPWTPVQAGASPELHAVGNGRLSSITSDSGAGGIRWLGHALTRWIPDATTDDWGVWIYARDLDDGRVWSIGRQPTGVVPSSSEVIFHPHMVELRRRDGEIALKLEVGIVAGDDVEIRRLTVVNEGEHRRRLAFVSYGEVVLAPPDQDLQHPAFSKLFVQAEEIPALDAVVFERKPRSRDEKPPVLLHRLVACTDGVRMGGVETARERFLGRDGSANSPRFGRHLAVSLDDRDPDCGLDPIMSIQAIVELEPGATERLAFLTMVAGSRLSVVDLAQRYATPAALEWVLADSASEHAREASRLDIDASLLVSYQRLLSLVLQQHSSLGRKPKVPAANFLSQHDLWRMGISGDLPIVLLRLVDSADTTVLEQLVRANRLWNRRGVATDLVVLHTGATGYADTVAEEIHDLLERVGALGILRRRGGVHLIRSDQISSLDLSLLAAVANVELDGACALQAQLPDLHRRVERLPVFVAPEPHPPELAAPARQRATDLLFDNGIGGFAADGSRYVISLRPGMTTPAPWCNVMANADFGTIVSESGGGYTWSVNASERRLSVWRNDPVLDRPSEALYLRDEETGVVWMPMAPSSESAVDVSHEAGCSRWRRCDHGLEQIVEVFVAADAPVKVIAVELRDLAGRARRLTATYYVEWVLANQRPRDTRLLVTEYEPQAGALLARNPWNPAFASRVAFLVCDRKPHGFTNDRCEFLGREGDIRHPAALRRWGLSDAAEPDADPCGALQAHVEIEPHATARTHFALGDERDREAALALAVRIREPDAVEATRQRVIDRWETLLGALTIQTPDPALDILVNRWLLYQSVSSRVLGRTGYYQSSGAYGFRDQLQDVLALLHVEPETVRAHILECARRQFAEGDVLHWWHPPEGRGIRTHCSDDLLWLPYAVAQYVRTTGDVAVLEERIPFLSAQPLSPDEHDRYALFEPGSESGTLFEHCARSLERGMTRGSHGLPLIGTGDWNDGMNRVGEHGRGESVWLAWFALATMRAFAELCSQRGEHDLAHAWERRAGELAAAAEGAGWDGRWYRRAYDDEGRPWGSAENDECRIDSIAQSWAMLSRGAEPDHARVALESAERELVREADGVARLLWPPFDKTDRDVGYIQAYPPGVRENGGQYSHAAAWLALALAQAGSADGALRVLHLLNPIEHARTDEAVAVYRVEPYVMAGDIHSVPPHVGRGGWTWYTGSAAWTWRAVVEGLLGLRWSETGVEIAPCIPASWPGFRIVLRIPFHGRTEIEVENCRGAGRGATELTVDGQVVAGSQFELPSAGEVRRVHLRLGELEQVCRAAG